MIKLSDIDDELIEVLAKTTKKESGLSSGLSNAGIKGRYVEIDPEDQDQINKLSSLFNDFKKPNK